MELNLDVLKERIREENEKADYYHKGVEMLLKKYEANSYFSREELSKVYPDLPDEFLDAFKEGEVDRDTFNLLSIDQADFFVQNSISLIGIGLGVFHLSQRSDDKDLNGYVGFLYKCRDDSEMSHVIGAFGALTMAMQIPPSFTMLSRFAPLTKNPKAHQITLDLVAEMNADLIGKFIMEAYPDYEGAVTAHKFSIPGESD